MSWRRLELFAQQHLSQGGDAPGSLRFRPHRGFRQLMRLSLRRRPYRPFEMVDLASEQL